MRLSCPPSFWKNRPDMKRHFLLIGLILVGFCLRLWQLPQTPPGLWYDEAYYAMDAAWLLRGSAYPPGI